VEVVEFVDGAGRLGKPYHGGAVLDWQDADLGTVAMDEDGTATAATPGTSLASITYRTRHHRWRVSSGAPRVQVYVEAGPVSGGQRITVMRSPGTRPAPAIVDPLLSGIEALRERGTQALADLGSSKVVVTLDAAMVVPILPGMLVEIATATDPPWRGKVISTAIACGVGTVPTETLSVERLA
jgi:hypothetical protein